MKVQQKIVAAVILTGLLTGVNAQAQESAVSLYGTLDVGVRNGDGQALSVTSTPSGAPGNTTAMASGVDRTGRWGIAGNEDLGSGYHTVFTLESDLYLNTGSNSPNTGTDKNTAAATTEKLFDRQAYVGLATPFGQILLGRQQSLIRDVIDGIDAVDGRFNAFNPNLQYTALNSTGLVSSALTYYGTGDPGNGSMMRQDNAVKYIGQAGPVTGSLLYSAGGVEGNGQSGSSEQGGLAYKDGPLALAGVYEVLNNPNDTLKLTAWTVGGRVTAGDWQVSANYGSNTADRTATTQIKTDIYSIGTTYAASSAVDLTLGYYKVDRSWTADAKPDSSFDRVIGYAEYKLSKKTLVFLEADYTKWGGDVTQFQGGATNKSTATGVTLGIDYKI